MARAKSMTRQLEKAMDAYDAGKITKAEYDALASRLQDKAMRLNERGIMSDAAYHRFEDVWPKIRRTPTNARSIGIVCKAVRMPSVIAVNQGAGDSICRVTR